MNKDLNDRADVENLINSFYEKVKKDDMIAFIFNDVAKVDWEKHLPVMYDFWESVIFQTKTFQGNPMLKHLLLNEKVALRTEFFERWLKLFKETVDE